MHAPTVFILSLLSLSASGASFTSRGTHDSGFSIPDGLPDGVYSVSFDDSGNAVHTRMEDIDARDMNSVNEPLESRDRAGGATLAKRDWGIDCGGHQVLQPIAVETAANFLYNECGDGKMVQVGTHIYGLGTGNGGHRVAAFFCLFSHNPTQRACYRSEASQRFAAITEICGWGVSGWTDWWNIGTKQYTYGYHAVDGNNNFCGRNH